MDLAALLDTIDQQAELILTGDGLRLVAPADVRAELGPTIRAHRDLLALHLAGRHTGHLLAFCTRCGAPTITAAKTAAGATRETWPTCRETPRCPGRHQPRPADLARWASCPAPPPQARPPAATTKHRLLGTPLPWPTTTVPR